MLRRAGIAVVFSVLLLTGFLAFESGRTDPDDPVYQGRRLSVWFEQFASTWSGVLMSGEPADRGAREPLAAMQALGTNALPWLIRQAFDFEPRGVWGTNRLVWTRFDQAPPPGGKRPLFRWPRLVPRFTLTQRAADAICGLRLPADALLNYLRDALRAKGTTRYRAALYLLGGVGANAEKTVPYLVAALRATNDVRATSLALQSLDRIGPAAKAAIPALLEQLSPPTPSWRLTRLEAMLGNFGPAAVAAAPALERLMGTGNEPSIRAQAAVALCQIRGNDPEAFALIHRNLVESHAEVQGSASISRETMLGAVGRVRRSGNALGRGLAPVLARLAEEEQGGYGSGFAPSTLVLNRLQPDVAAELWRRHMREDTRPGVRAWWACQLLRLQRTNEEAVTMLSQMVWTNLPTGSAPLQISWVSYLGEASSRSTMAVRTLERVAAQHEHPAVREEARHALEDMRWRESHPSPATVP